MTNLVKTFLIFLFISKTLSENNVFDIKGNVFDVFDMKRNIRKVFYKICHFDQSILIS